MVVPVSVQTPESKILTAYHFLGVWVFFFLFFVCWVFLTDLKVKQPWRQGIKFADAIFCKERK